MIRNNAVRVISEEGTTTIFFSTSKSFDVFIPMNSLFVWSVIGRWRK